MGKDNETMYNENGESTAEGEPNNTPKESDGRGNRFLLKMEEKKMNLLHTSIA